MSIDTSTNRRWLCPQSTRPNLNENLSPKSSQHSTRWPTRIDHGASTVEIVVSLAAFAVRRHHACHHITHQERGSHQGRPATHPGVDLQRDVSRESGGIGGREFGRRRGDGRSYSRAFWRGCRLFPCAACQNDQRYDDQPRLRSAPKCLGVALHALKPPAVSFSHRRRNNRAGWP